MERAGREMSQWLGERFEWSEDDREIAQFSLTLLMSSAYFIALLTLLSLLLGVLPAALVMAFSAGVLRTFAGGAHLSTGWRCGLISAILASAVAWSSYRLTNWLSFAPWVFWTGTLAVAVAVTAVMARYAPVDVPEKPIVSAKQRAALRRISLIVPAVWAAIWYALAGFEPQWHAQPIFHALWLSSAIGLLWETFSVVPPGIRFVHRLDKAIGRMAHSNGKGGVAP